MSDILKSIEEELPKGVISESIFEGANIVIYTSDKDFFKNGEGKIKEVVDIVKKRIELRADKKLLASEEDTEKTIKALVEQEAGITNMIFDVQRSTVIIEAKKPGMVIGKGGSILKDIKVSTLWTPTVQRSSAIPSKITEKIRSVLYANNNYRKKFLNDIGEKIYKEKQLQAGKFIGEIAKICGGGGGGKPNLAQAGGKDASKVEEALTIAKNKLIEALS